MSQFNFISPNFIVSSLKGSVSFYVEKLGFTVWHLVPDEEAPFFAMLGRDQVSIMMKEIGPEAKPIPNRGHHPFAPWDAYIHVADPDQVFEEYRSRGVVFHQPLHNNEDGLRGFEIADNDGYVLFFGKPL